MVAFSVTAQITTAGPPAAAFTALAQGRLLDLECERLVPGAAVSVALPVGDASAPGPAGSPITLLGYVGAIKPDRSVHIVHHQPWRGRLTIRFYPDDGGTRVVLESSIDHDGVNWLAQKRGYAPPELPANDRHRIGLLVSKSGSAAVFAQATESVAALAVAEINADGGIGGTPTELLVGDDSSDVITGAAAALRLMRSGCRTIFACVTSATFNAAAAALRGTDVLLIHTVLNEGGRPDPRLLRLGERPLEQVRAGIPALMMETGSRNWFFVGHRYSWSYGAHWAARRVIAECGGSVAGDSYLPMGSTDFSATVEAIERSGADLILSSLVGHDEVLFERSCAQQGLRSRTRTFALVFDEATQQLIGSSHADGVWAAFGYFQDLSGDEGLRNRYRASVVGPAPPLSSLSQTTYAAIWAYARATPGNEDRSAIRDRMITNMLVRKEDSPPVRRPILLAESRGGLLRAL